MKVLVFNAGSSSLKFGVFNTSIEDSRIFKGEYKHFKGGQCQLQYRAGGEAGLTHERAERASSPEEAIQRVPALLAEMGYGEFDAVGHRVAHGGDQFQHPVVINEDVERHIEECTPLAPLHNPLNLSAIRLSRKLWPRLPQVAVFDTAFHHTIPVSASTYAVPHQWRELGVRRYGFHGTSHKYIALRAAKALDRPVTALQIVSCHLGSGASVCAIDHGFSVDTSMGMTPLEGLVMGTRSGDVDPGLFAYLQRELGLDAQTVERHLYHDSGLKALAGSHDMRDLEQMAADGDAGAQLAIDIYAYRVRKYIGAYAAAMGGLDALVFTGGIGENSASMRRRICDKLEFFGLRLDNQKNQAVRLQGVEAPQIQTFNSHVRVIVTQTCEQLMIARETDYTLAADNAANKKIEWHIPVAVSARHTHLSPQAVEVLFGKGHQLTKLRQLTQTEGWAAQETVEVIGPKGTLKNVRVLGPTRAETQIEVSRTDTFALGVEAPVRPSGSLEHTPIVRLRGPAGEIETRGLIVAARHIHMSAGDAVRFGLKDGDCVDVRLSGERGISFSNTLIRVKDGYVTEMHIDTDEANAAGIAFETRGELVINDKKEQVDIVMQKNMALPGEGVR